ncbi:polyphosphate kinase 1 [Stieleria varia]|uniref:polyphosphate kinase 1 n=1 Tax=Stieleria varia TaxID=2528005 RepID=UPI001E323ABC
MPVDRFINRELSWLEFNQRVLEQAANESLPILERAKFLAITSSNLDEFMMVRVGGLRLQKQQNKSVVDPVGLTVTQQLHWIAKKAHSIVKRQYRLLREDVQPQLSDFGIRHVDLSQCSENIADAAEARFHTDIVNVLSPQSVAIDWSFPLLQGLGLQVCVRMVAGGTGNLVPEHLRAGQKADETDAADDEWDYAVIPLGKSISRVVPLPGDLDGSESAHNYVLLEDLVMHHAKEFFPGRDVVECVPFRLTRNADIQLREDEAADLLGGMEEVLEGRRYSGAVRLEYSATASPEMIAFLREALSLGDDDLFPIDGPLDLTYLFALHGLDGFEALRDPNWPAVPNPRIDAAEPMFSTIAAGDLLLVHPYERFDSVVRLIEEAAVDPDVLAIKQVLYRTSKKSPIVAALERAAENGKYVSAIVELKARFDEARNIEWAREMERAGVQVIYGVRGLKTHAKVCIIVRREPQGIVRYVHFGTGNYNEVTANLYSDVSLFTCDDVLGADASAFFNAVTGASQPRQLRELSSAPTTLRNRVMELIEGETERARQGQKGEIIAKLNALADPKVIDALYRASQAGVRIRLNIRGVCCLKPGVEGLSETIEVYSIVDRFLEHARVLYFRHGGDEQVLISSADWMPRNLDRRIELLIPVNDPTCRERLLETLKTYFRDNTHCWKMQQDGSYKKRSVSGKVERVRSQRVLYDEITKAFREAEMNRRTTFETHQAQDS